MDLRQLAGAAWEAGRVQRPHRQDRYGEMVAAIVCVRCRHAVVADAVRHVTSAIGMLAVRGVLMHSGAVLLALE